jgi:hypothetical protein
VTIKHWSLFSVSCDEPGCTERGPISDHSIGNALTSASEAGWSISPYLHYCPEHKKHGTEANESD